MLFDEILKYKMEHKIAFHPLADIPKKIRMMEEKNGQCICDNNRKCPCPEGLKEVYEEGQCLCGLFCTYEYGDKYLKNFFYQAPDNKPIDDIVRKQILKLLTEKK